MTLPEHVQYTGCPSWTITDPILVEGNGAGVECRCGAVWANVSTADLKAAGALTLERENRTRYARAAWS